MNWSSVFCMFGMALTRPSLTMQLMSGVDVCADKSRTLWQEMLQFLLNVTQFYIGFLETIINLNFLLPRVSAATYWRYGGKYYMVFVGNLLFFPAVKEFRKFVKKWQSYRHEFGVLPFSGTQCSNDDNGSMSCHCGGRPKATWHS